MAQIEMSPYARTASMISQAHAFAGAPNMGWSSPARYFPYITNLPAAQGAVPSDERFGQTMNGVDENRECQGRRHKRRNDESPSGWREGAGSAGEESLDSSLEQFGVVQRAPGRRRRPLATHRREARHLDQC
jgi:hypothetical protein